ncbi:hypothetical protein EJ131_28105 [Bacillus mycoides]|uniref:hypothetical protein n=1 Tax=Bacillus mycoides TaxID=1405 RepID=UPI0022B368CD|nr:hypothetical protein [Bacillus mycoides]MCZ6944274.1 hypothetical protein [Bacillus mycoides]
MCCERRCECDECNRRRRRVEIMEVERLGNLGRRRLDGLREGDKIRVFSGGDRIDGTGVFIRVEDGFLVWVDDHANINVTSLDVISVQRIS